jgi:S1-C subfamily serine protease
MHDLRLRILAFTSVAATVAAVLSSIGCERAMRQHVDTVRRPMRAASVEPWVQRKIDGRPAKTYGLARRAMLIIGADHVDIELKDNRFMTLSNFTCKGRPLDSIGKGTAAAITADGYFVTAAHCLPTDPDRPFLIIIDANPLPTAFVGRVVHSCWDPALGCVGKSFADFAIIHAEGAKPRCFEWSPAESLQPKAPILAFGIADGSESTAGGEFIGLVTSDEGKRRAPYLEKFAFSAPTTSGDSGGPVMLADGTLLGVLCEVHLTLKPDEWHNEGIRADPAWVKDIIAGDRASRSTATP